METKLRRKEDLRLLYYRYKDSPLFAIFIVALVIFVTVFLLVKVLIPQLQNWFSIRDELAATKERIQVLSNNQLYITNASTSDLENNFKIAATALPFEKDFPGVLNAISAASITTGAILDDYSFQVGNLSTKSAELNKQQSISLELNMQGSLDVIEGFLNEIYTKLPLAEVVGVSYNEGTAGIRLLFYYKVIPGQINVTYTKPLTPLSPESLLLLEQLSEWRDATTTISTIDPNITTETGSEEASLTPF